MASRKANRIVSDPNIMMGKPVVSGTRITVESILEKLGEGESIENVLDSYPQLSREDIYEALSFASRTMKDDIVYPIAS